MEYTRAPDTSIIVAVVEAVSSFENSSPTSLPPLYDVVDTDALNALFETGSDATSDHGVSISFVFSDSHVTIESGEQIVVEAETASNLTA